MSSALRYLGDKVVDNIINVLVVMVITGIIAAIPYLVLPKVPTGFVFLSVAIAAFVGILIVVFILPRFHKKATHDLRRILLSLEKNGEMWLLGYDHDTWAKHNPDIIKSAAKDKHVKFTFLFFYPQSKMFRHAMESMLMEDGSSKTGLGSVDNLRKIKRDLGELGDKIQIKFCDLSPVCSMVIVNPSSDTGAVAHLWPHMYNVLYANRLWLTYEKAEAGEQMDFEKCKASYEYADSMSWADGAPIPESVEIVQAEEVGLPSENSAEDKIGTEQRLSDLVNFVYAPLYSAALEMKEGGNNFPHTNLTVGNLHNPWSSNPKIIQQVVDIFEKYSALIENDDVRKGWDQNKDQLRKGKFWYGKDTREWLESIEKEYLRIRSLV